MKKNTETMWHDVTVRMVKMIDLIAITYVFYGCWMHNYSHQVFGTPFYGRGNWFVVFLFTLLFIMFNRVYDGFAIAFNQVTEIIYSQILALVMANGVMYFIMALLFRRIPGPIALGKAFLWEMLVVIVWSFIANKWYFWTFKPQNTAVIYSELRSMEDLIGEYGLEKKFDIKVSMHIDEYLNGAAEALNDMDAVFVCGIPSHERNMILKQCVEHNVTMYMIPRIGDAIMTGARRMHMFHLPVLSVGRYHPRFEFLFIKRAFDIVVSALALIVASPFMLITAIAIKATDGGPVFYKQVRLTKDRKEFKVIKFRSMRVDAEKDGVARLSSGENDDRITPIGKFIRKVRIDELPQLFNILVGDMSIVGPRPERPEIAAEYEKELPEFALRLQAKAGLTGYAQVYGKYNTIPYDKLQMDLMYIAHPSLLEDLQIIFATIKILFMPESTEGIDADKTTAAK
ncbi:exopolysaccharide biosynthesis polyprenyl glycosylphosphotransferase [Lachnospiraceae bacterium XBD2001]|nr:exopolysaccharide biosynthesis polyprenyl glycosylphosphotransferase [Lachnospiraceae bacterium XBD2001]